MAARTPSGTPRPRASGGGGPKRSSDRSSGGSRGYQGAKGSSSGGRGGSSGGQGRPPRPSGSSGSERSGSERSGSERSGSERSGSERSGSERSASGTGGGSGSRGRPDSNPRSSSSGRASSGYQGERPRTGSGSRTGSRSPSSSAGYGGSGSGGSRSSRAAGKPGAWKERDDRSSSSGPRTSSDSRSKGAANRAGRPEAKWDPRPQRNPVVRKGWGSVARRGASTVREGTEHGPDKDTPEGRRRSKRRTDEFVPEQWIEEDRHAKRSDALRPPAHRAVPAQPELSPDIANELASAAGPDWNHLRERITERMAAGIGAYERERPRDASRILKTVVDAVPSSPSARELLALSQY